MKRNRVDMPGFKGQNSDNPAERIEPTELVAAQNILINDGEADGDNVGTLSLGLTTNNGFAAQVKKFHHFKSSGGSEFILGWTGADIAYHVVGSTTVTSLSMTLTSSIPPAFVNWGNEYIIILCGVDGVFRITASGATLTKTQIYTVPMSSFGYVDNGMLYIAQDTSLAHSAPGDPLRWIPKVEETTATPPIYTNDFRVTFASAGVNGETMAAFSWKGIKFLFTQYELFTLIWDGGSQSWPTIVPGYGLKGFESFSLLDDRIRFYSTYKQGSICEIVLGSAGDRGEVFSIGQGVTITIIEHQGAKKVADILRACPAPTAKQMSISIDSQANWNDTSLVVANTAMEYDVRPGWAYLKGATKQTILSASTPVWAGDGEPLWAISQSQGETNPAGDYDGTQTGVGTFQAWQAHQTYIKPFNPYSWNHRLFYMDVNGNWQELACRGTNNNVISQSIAKQTYTPIVSPIAQGLRVRVEFRVYSSDATHTYSMFVARDYRFAPCVLAYFDIYGFTAAPASEGYGQSTYVTIYETEVYGLTPGGENLITTAALYIPGLVTGDKITGVFQIAYEGTGNELTGGLTGTGTPAGVEIGLSTNGGSSYTTDVLVTTPVNELKAGYNLKDLDVTVPADPTQVRARIRVPMTLDATGASPAVDKLIIWWNSGAAATSVFPMFTWRDKTILCLLASGSSTGCDKAVVLNENGQMTAFSGINWTAGVRINDRTYVSSGYGASDELGIARLFDGADNYLVTTNTPMEKIIRTKKFFGPFDVIGRKFRFLVSKYTPNETSLFAGTIVITEQVTRILHFNVFPFVDNLDGAWTATPGTGKAEIDETNPLYGAGALMTSGDGTLTRVLGDVFGAKDFTFDISVRPKTPELDRVIVFFESYTDADNYTRFWQEYTFSTDTFVLRFKSVRAGVTVADYTHTATSDLTIPGNYTHVELGRANSNLYLFVAGTELTWDEGGTAIGAAAITAATDTFYIGSSPVETNGFDTSFDECRILSGQCAHTATFTPPTGEYS